jgi:lipopolysaccharide heptosyltransferase I
LKILIVKLSSIGDIVHALPALAIIRQNLPDAEIGWAVDSRYAETLRGNQMIDHLIEINTRKWRGGQIAEEMVLDIGKQIGGVRKFKFDIGLDMQGLLKSATLAKLGGVKKRYGFDKSVLREPAARFLYSETVPIPPQTHVINKNITLAESALGIDRGSGPLEFPIFTNDEHAAEADLIAERAGGKFAILNPAGGWVTKLWPAENYGKLADMIYAKLGLTSVVAVGPGDDLLADTVLQNSTGGKSHIAKPSLKGFYELAKRSSIYVGGDTGPTHIAIAAGTPIVGIFGPTEWWRNGSLNPDDICVERNDISCRVDCHRRTCSNWICMDISVETVFDAIAKRHAEARTK